MSRWSLIQWIDCWWQSRPYLLNAYWTRFTPLWLRKLYPSLLMNRIWLPLVCFLSMLPLNHNNSSSNNNHPHPVLIVMCLNGSISVSIPPSSSSLRTLYPLPFIPNDLLKKQCSLTHCLAFCDGSSPRVCSYLKADQTPTWCKIA